MENSHIYDNWKFSSNFLGDDYNDFDLYVEQEYFNLPDNMQLELDNDQIKYNEWVKKLEREFSKFCSVDPDITY